MRKKTVKKKRIVRKVGAPTKYTKALTKKICDHLVNGKSLREISELSGMPNRATVFRWLREHDEFRDQYARARAAGRCLC